MKNDSVFISVVIPVRNEAGSLPKLMEELDAVIQRIPHPVEVIFVNDCSTDDSKPILDEYSLIYQFVSVIHSPKQMGQTGCYQVAFGKAKGKYIIRMDGDLQDDPHDLHKFVPYLEDGADLVMGLRELRKHKRLLRFASILYDSFVVLLFDSPLHTNTSSFIAFKSCFVKDIVFKKNDHRYLPVIAMERGARKIKEVIVVNRERLYGVSKYNNFKKMVFGIPEVIRFFARVKLGEFRTLSVSEEKT